MPAKAPAENATDTSRAGLLDRPLRTSGLLPPQMAGRLGKLGLVTVRDLLFHLPRRYDDFSRPVTLRELRERTFDAPVSATVEIVELRVEQGFRRRVQRTVARLRDDTGEGEAVWFGRRYIERRLAAGQTVALSGKVELRGWLPRFQNPEFGPAGDESLHAGRIVPVYLLTAGVLGTTLRARIRDALDAALPVLDEYLPVAVRRSIAADLPEIADAVHWVHFPPQMEDLDRALHRLAFDELLALQLGMVSRLRRRGTERGEPIEVGEDRFSAAIRTVESVIGLQVADRRRRLGNESQAGAEVSLTPDQRSALDAIRADLARTRPMVRLLQGDVGSGKTAVAALAMAFVADAGPQAALLAPTDLLARQHAQTLSRLLAPLGHDVTLLTGSLGPAARQDALEVIAAPVVRTTEGRTRGRVVVGTHALVQERVAFADLSLAVVDEQHRFGVAEREALSSKGRAPHILLMTATPIPRTLGQIVHADLDVTDLRTPPAGRLTIATAVRHTDELVRRRDGKQGGLGLIAVQVAAGYRAFVVVPLVEDDPASGAKSVEEAAQLIRDSWQAAAEVAGVSVAQPEIEIVHGQMKASERDARMERFRSGDVQVLVGTTVLEVGVDVPEATVMLILNADRFGLAQLHQLRGRVGRGDAQSYCVLVSDEYPAGDVEAGSDKAAVKARLDALAMVIQDGNQRRPLDGFELAEKDLQLRREGELLGLTQSGLPPLRVASLGRAEHRALSLRAREIAEQLLDDTGRLPGEFAALEREVTGGWLKRVGAGEVIAAGTDA